MTSLNPVTIDACEAGPPVGADGSPPCGAVQAEPTLATNYPVAINGNGRQPPVPPLPPTGKAGMGAQRFTLTNLSRQEKTPTRNEDQS